MSLLRAERRRLFKRRFTRWMLVIGVLVLAAVATGLFVNNSKATPARIAAAEREADNQYRLNIGYIDSYRQRCQAAQKSNATPDPNEHFPTNCDDIQPPTRDEFLAVNYLSPTFNFRQNFPVTITMFAGVFALIFFVIGASFVGAEWTSGGMMNLLLWRPRRLQVFFTKLGTLLGGLFPVVVVFAAAWTAACWAIATFHGTTAKMTPGVWRSLALTGTRGVLLALVMAAVGFALAAIGRHTAVALGIAAGVAVVGQLGLALVLANARIPFWERWFLPTYINAWMNKTVKLEDFRACQFAQGQCHPREMLITWQQSGLLFGTVLVLLIAIAAWLMKRRDVT